MDENGDFLAQLPVQMKERILTYVAQYHSGGITRSGLNVLFPFNNTNADEYAFETIALSRKDEQDLQNLNLSRSRISTSAFRNFLTATIPDTCLPRFPNLTHLSLDMTSVAHTLDFPNLLARELPQITHLSLAGVFSGENVVSGLILLSRKMVCVEYVDLSYMMMLSRKGGVFSVGWTYEIEERETGLDRLDWSGGWRGVRTLVIRECGYLSGMERDIREAISRKRHGKGWVDVVIEL
jgi:hypothetical protein